MCIFYILLWKRISFWHVYFKSFFPQIFIWLLLFLMFWHCYFYSVNSEDRGCRVFCEVHMVKILGFVGCIQSVLHILLCFVSFFSLFSFSSFCPFLFSFFSFLPPFEHMKTILRLGHTKSTSRLEQVHLLWFSSPWYRLKTVIAIVLITGRVLERLAPNF